jgi:LytS/YehU family sensor histidine kinase
VIKKSDGAGVGLDNTKQRLLQLYGNEAQFGSGDNEKNGFSVMIEIPLKNHAS